MNCLNGLHTPHGTGNRAKHRGFNRLRGLREHALQTWSLRRMKNSNTPLHAPDCAVDQRNPLSYRALTNGMTRGKIIKAIQNDICISHQRINIFSSDFFRKCLNFHIGIDRQQRAAG